MRKSCHIGTVSAAGCLFQAAFFMARLKRFHFFRNHLQGKELKMYNMYKTGLYYCTKCT